MAPRQVRLDVGDAEVDLAETWANYRVLPKPYVSATALAAFATCRTKPFLQRVLDAAGFNLTTWAMRAGIRAHEEVQGALDAAAPPTTLTLEDALAQKQFAFATEYGVRDGRRNLRGIADIVYVAHGEAHVLELKNMRPPNGPDPFWNAPVWFDHGVQAQFYGMLLAAELGTRPWVHVSYLLDGSKAAFLDSLAGATDAEGALTRLAAASASFASTLQTDRYLGDLVRDLRRAERGTVLPMPGHEDAAKCAQCPVRTWCPRRLDQPGDFAQVPVSALAIPP